jgi:hypothetical protein
MFPAADRHHQPPLLDGTEDGLSTHAPSMFGAKPGDDEWLDYARSSYNTSDTWFGASMRSRLERDLAAFYGRHAPGSKYHTEQYLKKSRLFRPKTRSAIRRGEAGHAIAFFSTSDVVNISPRNDTDPRQVLAAEVHNALCNERLNDPKTFWFKTLIGGAQDAMTHGTVISKTCWDFKLAEREIETEYTERQPDGRTLTFHERSRETRVLVDRPVCKILPIENLRIDPGCDWIDPVNSTPYIIEMQPTYIYEIKARMREGKYRQLADGVLIASSKDDWDAIRKARTNNRLDQYGAETYINDHRIVWVHHHIMHVDGQDWVYDTLGAGEVLLMDPVAIEEYYLHSQTFDRPYQIGSAIIEAHKNYPGGIPALIEDLQEQTNDIANLRIDNVRHALNPRWVIRRGSGVDARGLIRNVASGVTYATNPTNDIREIRAQDVTRSAYEEQDRLNADIDDMVGTFSGGSVQTNRKMGETVGGMRMLQGDANRLEEYMIRTVSETWVEGVMRQFVALEAAYESDELILKTVAAQLGEDMEAVMDVLDEPLNVRCNVGFDATNPQRRIDRIALGFATVNAYMPGVMTSVDAREAVKEIFAPLGFKDGTRLFPALKKGGQDPRIAQLEQENAQLKQALESESYKEQTKIQVAQISAGQKDMDSQRKLSIEAARLEFEAEHSRLQSQIDQIDARIRLEDSAMKRDELYLQREALSHEIQESDRQFMLEIARLGQEKEQGKQELMAKKGEGKKNGAAGPAKPAAAPAGKTGGSSAGPNGKAATMANGGYGMVPFAADGVAPP